MKNIVYSLLIFASLILNACSSQILQAEPKNKIPSNNIDQLKLIWETPGLSNPESVIYHTQSDILLVSNINGSPIEKDGNGYISKIMLDGTILNKQWVVGLNAPKGLAIHDNTLYVADIDTLVMIDIPSGNIINRYQVADAKFLNDVVANKEGDVFVSDTLLNRIHRWHNGQFKLWLESPELENPNGLHVEGENLILGTWGVMTDGFETKIPGHLKSISIKDKSINSLGGTPIGNLDGVESNGKDGYYVTDWMVGKLYSINKKGTASLLLELEQGLADHEVILNQNLILLPMMKNDKLVAYKILN